MEKRFSIYSNKGFFVLLIVSILSIGLMFYQMITGLITVSPVYLEKSDEFVTAEEIFYPGTTSEVTIKAFPPNGDETTAVIRYEVINGEIVSVTPLRSIAMGACENGSMFTSNQICVDISDGKALIDGENLLAVELKWGNKGSSYIKANDGNGFFNGLVFTDENLANYSNDEFTLPLTGDEALDDNKDQFVKGIDNIVLFLGSFTFILLTFFGIRKLIYSAVK